MDEMIRKLRICLLLNRMENSGPIKGAIAMYKEMKRIFDLRVKIDPQVVVLEGKPMERLDFIDIDHPDITYLNCKGWSNLIIAYIGFLKLLRRNKYDCIISFGLRSNIVNSLIIPKVVRVAVVKASTIKEPMELDYINNSDYFYRKFGIYAGYISAGIKDITVYCFNEMIQNDRENYLVEPKKFYAIPNFLDEDATLELLNKGGIDPLDEYLFNDNSVKFISVSLLNKKKNTIELIESFKKLVNQGLRLSLLIVGDGEERQKLEKMVNEWGLTRTIKFLGYKKNPLPYIKKSDCLILSSLTDATPRAAMEAIFLGVPVILPDLVGLNKLVTSNNGLIYKRGNLEKSIIEFIINRGKFNPKLPEEFRQKNAVRRYIEVIIENLKC